MDPQFFAIHSQRNIYCLQSKSYVGYYLFFRCWFIPVLKMLIIQVYFFGFFKTFFFLMWIIFKVLIEFVTILLLFYILGFFFWLQGTWDPNSLTRHWTCTPYTGRQNPNHWPKEASVSLLLWNNFFPRRDQIIKLNLKPWTVFTLGYFMYES